MVQQILRFLRQFESRQLYFWLGFIAGGIFFWFLSRLRIWLPRARVALKKQILETRQSLATSTETRLRNDILRMVQRMHLAAPLFALDEIAIPPSLLAPPPSPLEEGEVQEKEGIDSILPYIPDWPELAATYHAPVLSLAEALKGGANLILTGNPGSGKTVALAHLVSQICRRTPGVGELADKLPLLVHVADIRLEDEAQKGLLDPLIAAVSLHASALTLPRLPVVIHSAFERGDLLLLLDGLDEMPPGIITEITGYIKKILEKYPQARMVVTATMDNYNGLLNLGMIPVAMAAWNEAERAAFIRQWGDAWHSYISTNLPEPVNEVDPLLLIGWLQSPDPSLTPLELTLKTWAAYAGDTTGPTAPEAIETYINRITSGIPDTRSVLEKLATQMVFGLCPTLDSKVILKWAPEQNSPTLPPSDAALSTDQSSLSEGDNLASPEIENPISEESISPITNTRQPSQAIAAQQLIPKLIDSGILISRLDAHINFNHPVITGYLAGTVLSNLEQLNNLGSQPAWTGKALTLHYLSTWNDLTYLTQPVFTDKGDTLYRSLFGICRWLRDTSKTARWRSLAMRHLAGLVTNESLSLGIRTRALTALILTGDPGVPVLLRSLLTNQADSVRLLGAWGCGLAKDSKSVKELINLLEDLSPSVKIVAMFTLASIGSRDGLDIIAHSLLHGTEEIRRASAEALANLPEEGYPALSEGATLPDLLVRRAVVHGLARVKQPWAIHILEKIQIEDEQWVVRNAAIQALEDIKKPNPRIPQILPPLHQIPWLIEYAGKQGIGVSPGKPVVDLLSSALQSTDRKDRLAAIFLLSYQEEQDTAPELLKLFHGTDKELQDAAYQALWQKAACGFQLPTPASFGIS